MSIFVISIGSNYGDRYGNVNRAIAELKTFFKNKFKVSDIYETPCAGKEGNPYLNAVFKGESSDSLLILEKKMKKIESEMGRDEECRKRGDVPIDLDIVIKDFEILKEWDYRQIFFKIGYETILKEN